MAMPISEPRSITEVVESENSKLRKEIEELRKEQVKCKCQIKANPAPILKGDALDFQNFCYLILKALGFFCNFLSPFFWVGVRRPLEDSGHSIS